MCVNGQGVKSACGCAPAAVREDRVLVLNVNGVGMYMLKSAGKRTQLLVYVYQLFPVAKV
jgi:hypothetical protein